RHALAIEPAKDQRTIQVQQVLPGVRFSGLGTKQQGLSGFAHVSILPPSDQKQFQNWTRVAEAQTLPGGTRVHKYTNGVTKRLAGNRAFLGTILTERCKVFR